MSTFGFIERAVKYEVCRSIDRQDQYEDFNLILTDRSGHKQTMYIAQRWNGPQSSLSRDRWEVARDHPIPEEIEALVRKFPGLPEHAVELAVKLDEGLGLPEAVLELFL